MSEEKKILIAEDDAAGKLATASFMRDDFPVLVGGGFMEGQQEFSLPLTNPASDLDIKAWQASSIRNRFRTNRDNSTPFNFSKRKKRNKQQRHSRRQNRKK